MHRVREVFVVSNCQRWDYIKIFRKFGEEMRKNEKEAKLASHHFTEDLSLQFLFQNNLFELLIEYLDHWLSLL